MHDVGRLIAAGDPDELLLAVDRLSAARDWDGLVDLARRCREAVELGRQLWPVSMHIEYRLALEAPGPWAGAVVEPGAAPFALGPLTEVVADRHTWDEVATHLPHPASAAAVAQERAIRGEPVLAPELLHDLPSRLADFEPSYALPQYEERRATFPPPPVATGPLGAPRELPVGTSLEPDDACRALHSVVETWVTQSSGRVEVVVTEGGIEEAIGLLAPTAAVRPLEPADALAVLQWAGASGGTHGRRRGGAAGRFSTLWAGASLAGLEWPATVGEDFLAQLGAAVRELRWARWEGPGPSGGWRLRLAVADPLDGLAWAIDAHDPPEADDVVLPGGRRTQAPPGDLAAPA